MADVSTAFENTERKAHLYKPISLRCFTAIMSDVLIFFSHFFEQRVCNFFFVHYAKKRTREIGNEI